MSRGARTEALGLTCESWNTGRLTELFDQDVVSRAETDLWRWRFEEDPFGSEIVCARDDGGRIQALLAAQLVPVWVGERASPAALVAKRWLSPAVESPRARYALAVALGEVLGERLRDREASIVFWCPAPPDDRPGQKYLRHDAVRLVNPIRMAAGELRAAIPAPAAAPVPLSELEDVEGLWQRAHAQLGVTTVRSLEYLDWRYERHPRHDYHFFTARSAPGELEAVGVVRADSEAATAYLVDWLVPVEAREAGARLAAGIAGWAEEQGLAALEAWFCESSPYFQAAQEAGFRLQPGERLLVARPLLRSLGIEMLRVCWNLVYGDLPDH